MSDLTGKFVLKAPYKPSGDQPQAIEALAAGVQQGMEAQVLLGVTGSGKTEVVVDPIGAGNGEIVLLCKGSSARIVFGPKTPVDTVVVGIVENVVS